MSIFTFAYERILSDLVHEDKIEFRAILTSFANTFRHNLSPYFASVRLKHQPGLKK